MKSTRWAPLGAAVLVAAAAACGPPAALAAAPMGCLIEPERVTDIGSPVVGVIERIEVERGQTVRRGQVLAVLRADVERANLEAASSRADSDADIKSAAASAAFNRERLVRTEDLFRQQFVSRQALDQARAEAQMADQKLAQAREQRQITQHERSLAAAQLSQRVIRSPMDGVVAERWLSAGERVDEKPLLRIARVDPLRVQLVVPVALYGQVQMRGRANVQPDLPGAAAVAAWVTMIDRVVDPASNTFRVQLELPNAQATLPAGLRCKAEFVAEGPAGRPLPASGMPPTARSTPLSEPPGAPPAMPAGGAPPARGPARPAGLALALTLAAPPPASRAIAPPAADGPAVAARMVVARSTAVPPIASPSAARAAPAVAGTARPSPQPPAARHRLAQAAEPSLR